MRLKSPDITESNIFRDYTSPRSGYFGDKKSPPIVLKKRNEPRVYPNYLKRDPREYPPVHYCEFRETSTTKYKKPLPLQ